MATVYRAAHVGHEAVPAAVKVITAAYAGDPRFVASLENEVRAVARLDHSGIVRVFDYGKVDEEAAAASSGALAAGSPYLVMELASGGTLARARRPLSFGELYPVLRFLLGALGHAHARGVIHRDLKPDNVLIATASDLRPGMKLTDFGISKAQEQESGDAGGGTPAFMAPEQFFGRKADAGPWTDLYALGCVSYLLSVGRLPFSGTPVQLALAHTAEEAPRLTLGDDYPADFEDWVRCSMEKEPRARFQRAADAAQELQAIARRRRRQRASFRPSEGARNSDIEVALSPSGLLDLLGEEKTVLATGNRVIVIGSSTHLETLPASADVSAVERWRELLSRPRVWPQRGVAAARAPIPASWRALDTRERRFDLAGVGLGLFGLREVPLVGRDDARDVLWEKLVSATAGGGPELVLIRADPGQGKTRLAEWLLTTAHEIGAGTNLRATHAETASPMDGLPRMLGRHLSVVGLPPPETALRVEDWLRARGQEDRQEALALAELISPSATKHVRFHDARERYRLVDRVIDLEARERSVIVFIDDVQWGSDALGYVQHALGREGTPRNLLFVLGARTDLSSRPTEASLLSKLSTAERVRELPLAPLSEQQGRRLVEELLGLEAELARKVVERAGGNPMFAVQLVGDWVQRGVLTPSAHGWSLARPAELDVPDDVYQLWSARLAPVVRGHPENLRALAFAAVLGRDVIDAEWRDVLAASGEPLPSASLLDGLLREDLARRIEGGWSFVHVLLRESIVRAAKRSNKFEEISRRSGEALVARAREGDRVAERAGRHLYDGHAYTAASEWLLAGARERWYLSDYPAVTEILDLRDLALTRGGFDESSLRFVDGWLLRAEVSIRTDAMDRGIAWAEKVERTCHLAGERRQLAEARRLLAVAEYMRGEFATAKERYTRALATFTDVGDVIGAERCRIGLGDVAYRLGDLDEAGRLYGAALGPLERVGAIEYVADALYGTGYVAMWRRRHDEARACFVRELEIFEALGDRFGIGRVNNSLGEIARLTEQWAEAEQRYRRTLQICEALDLPRMRSVVLINLGLVLMAVHRDDEADPFIREGHAALLRSGSRGDEAAVLGAVLAMDAFRNDWDAWDRTASRLVELVEETQKADGDLAWELEQAATRALNAGERDRALFALRVAEKQWAAIGREDAANQAIERARGIERPGTS